MHVDFDASLVEQTFLVDFKKIALFLMTSFSSMQVPSFISSIKHEEAIGSAGIKPLRVFALLGVGFSGALAFASLASADEAEHGLPAPSYPWPHDGILSSYDHAS